MAGLFNRAADKSKSTKNAGKSKKNTTWKVGDKEGDMVGKAVHDLVRLSAEEKALKAKMSIHKNTVKSHADQNFVDDFSELGVMPDTPMKVINEDGDSVTFVVQDRGGQYNLKDEQVDALSSLLGEDVVDDLIYTENKISFDRLVMSIPGVSEEVEKSLESAIRRLMKKGVLTEENADELIKVETKTSVKPGTLERAAQIVGRNTTKLAQFLDALGSSVCRYIKT